MASPYGGGPEAWRDILQKGAPTSDEKMWAMFAHLSFFVLGVFGPLIIWMMKKQESAFVEDQAKEALNFQLCVFIFELICAGTCVLSPLCLVVAIAATVYSIMGAMESNKGICYRYPYITRMIS